MAQQPPPGSGQLALLQVPAVALADVLHEIAQPLTVLAALLAVAELAAEPALTGDHLAIASGECHRAIEAVRSLQMLSIPDETVIETEGHVE